METQKLLARPTRQCRMCLKHKDLSDFYASSASSKCKECFRAAQNRNWARKYYPAKFGLGPDDYETMLAAQNYACAICGKNHVEKPEKKWGRARLAVDHEHGTGRVRGLLCTTCNAGLGFFRDSPKLLTKAVEYLTQK